MRRLTALGALAASVGVWAAPADRFAGIEIKTQHVSGTVHMLEGAGGNIGASVGVDGTLIIDDQFAPLAEKITQALEALGGNRPKLILNTHFHGDHTGGNPTFAEQGTIIAHDNVRLRLVNDDEFPRSGLPLVTYDDDVTVHFNDEQIQVIHMPRGHTDGDSVAWFKNANVIHMGDHFFNGFFPFIDVQNGGTVDGFVANVERILEMVPEDIRVIPGHGPLATVVELADSIRTIKATSTTIREGLEAGRSAADIETDLADYAKWGSGFISTERWIQIIQQDANGPDTGGRR
jgi:glyoxylase-like metal-dependent hydrolase (beta-lactamase superfamily II)